MMHAFTIYHMNLVQSTALDQKRFDLLLLSPTLCNLWLLLVYSGDYIGVNT